ncbi:MAG: dipeptide epimerase [Chitinophagaceae bacterium]|nr:dipeptide epimerase [Chitinophagaceae bacterium]
MKVRYTVSNLAFRYPFTISKGTKTHQPSLIVELEHMGVKGYGEAPAINYYNITVEKMIEDLERKKQFIEKFAFTEPARYWHYLHHLLPKNNFLVCALDMAAWDLYGKLRKQPLYKIWGLNYEKAPLCDYTIGIDTIGTMIEKMKALPWPIYKIKLGTSEDIEIVTALRKHTDAIIRVDANAAWTEEEALQKIPLLFSLNVELVEQPLAKDDWEGMKKIYANSSIPLIADEACVVESDVEKCVNHFHGINIKLTKCSGITPALRMIETARGFGMKVMVGSMNESTIGTAAIAHLLPLLDYVDMDGPLLLAEDIATGISFDKGKVIVSDAPGLGIDISAPVFESSHS